MKVHRGAAWVMTVIVLIQFFTAGLMVFPGLLGGKLEQFYGFHALPGFLAILTSLVMLIAGLAGKVGSRTNIATGVLFLLAVAQMFLAHITPRVLGALHVFDALMIAWLTYELNFGRFRATADTRAAAVTVAAD